MRINRHDTNGMKPLLGKGELGYDDYTVGGDAGRVYVGTGSVNIPQAKKAEVVAVDGKVDTHVVRVDNPHSVTKIQVGLGSVDNTSDIDKPISTAVQTALDTKQAVLVSGTNIKTIEGQSIVGSGNIDLSKSDVGLSNVDNTSDANKPVSSATQTALNNKLDSATYTASDVLTKLKTVDGTGSGLDADLLDGRNSTDYVWLDKASGETRQYFIKTETGGYGRIGAFETGAWINYLDLADRLYYKGTGLLYANEKAVDSAKLNGMSATTSGAANSIAQRGADGGLGGVSVVAASSNEARVEAFGGTNKWKFLRLSTNGVANWDIGTLDGSESNSLRFRTGDGTDRFFIFPTGETVTTNTIYLQQGISLMERVTGKEILYHSGEVLNIGWGFSDVRITNQKAWHNGNNAISAAGNGYTKLANGLIIQWGQTSNAATQETITFPYAFTTYCAAATITPVGTGATYASLNEAPTTTQIVVNKSTGYGIRWIAIGY